MAKGLTLSQLRATDISTLSDKALRQAYTAFRDVMQKRITRLASGTASQRAYAAPFQAGGSKELKTLAQLKQLPRKGWSKAQLRREMEMRVKELQVLERSERTSLSGWANIEKRTVSALQRAGYKNINKSNLKSFGDYMEKMRSVFGNKIFPSEEAAELYDTVAGESGKVSESELFNRLSEMVGDSFGVDLFA